MVDTYLDLWKPVYFLALNEDDIHASNGVSLLKETKLFVLEDSKMKDLGEACTWDRNLLL